MSDKTLYDDDILLWSERQAEIIRRLRQSARDLPNEFDAENVAEEIESVGRSELAAVKSLIRLILLHIVKLSLETDALAARHWRGEIAEFQADLGDRYAPSMRQRIDIDEIWDAVRAQAAGSVEDSALARLPEACPVTLDDLVSGKIDIAALVQRLVRLAATGTGA